MKRFWLFVLGSILLLKACAVPQLSTSSPVSTGVPKSVPPNQGTSISITDALGRQVELSAPPKRIVITGKSLVMIADATYMFPQAKERIIGLGSAGQGASNFISLIDPQYAAKAVLENEAGAEQIAALKPDLVLLKSYLAETTGRPIEALHIPVVYVDFETPEQYTRDIAILGQIFQDEQRAAQVNAYFQSKVEQVERTVASVDSKPRVLMLYYSDKDGVTAFNVPPSSWMQTQLVLMAGGEPVWLNTNPGKGWAQVTLEQIAAWDADQIYVISYNKNSSDVVKNLQIDPTWQALRAAKQANIYAFPADIYSWDQPDTRWILGLTWLAAHLHPDRFSQVDISGEAQEFYQILYGLDKDFFEQNIRPTFKGDLP